MQQLLFLTYLSYLTLTCCYSLWKLSLTPAKVGFPQLMLLLFPSYPPLLHTLTSPLYPSISTLLSFLKELNIGTFLEKQVTYMSPIFLFTAWL